MKPEVLKKFFIAIIEDDLAELEYLAKENHISDYIDKCASGALEIELLNAYPVLDKNQSHDTASLAMKFGSEGIIRFLITNGLKIPLADWLILYRRNPHQFPQLFDRNPSWRVVDNNNYLQLYYCKTPVETNAMLAEILMAPSCSMNFIRNEIFQNNKLLPVNWDKICQRIQTSTKQVEFGLLCFLKKSKISDSKKPAMITAPELEKLIATIELKNQIINTPPIVLADEMVSTSTKESLQATINGLMQQLKSKTEEIATLSRRLEALESSNLLAKCMEVMSLVTSQSKEIAELNKRLSALENDQDKRNNKFHFFNNEAENKTEICQQLSELNL